MVSISKVQTWRRKETAKTASTQERTWPSRGPLDSWAMWSISFEGIGVEPLRARRAALLPPAESLGHGIKRDGVSPCEGATDEVVGLDEGTTAPVGKRETVSKSTPGRRGHGGGRTEQGTVARCHAIP
jgi:hypothetical protein